MPGMMVINKYNGTVSNLECKSNEEKSVFVPPVWISQIYARNICSRGNAFLKMSNVFNVYSLL